LKRRAIKKLLYCYICLIGIQVVILLLSLITGVKASTANHLVISEVQISGTKSTDDFIELYNPTNQEISLDGYRLVKRTKTGTTDTTLKSFSSADKIPIYGFYLWANSDYTAILIAPDAATSGSIASDNGIALRHGDENTGEIIDSAAWGAAANAFVEGAVFGTNPPAGKSLERKASATSTAATMISGGTEADKGNGQDSNNNANDFILRDVSNPQNKSFAFESPPGIVWPPPNNPPTAEAGADQTVFKNATVSFSSTGSTDSDGTIVSYLWNFGDSSTSTEANPDHIYALIGNYSVNLTVTDDDLSTASDTCAINVIDLPVYSQNIFINEFLPAPGSTHDWDNSGLADSNDEWIELINLGNDRVDLGNWMLKDSTDTGIYQIPASTFIDPDGFKVFYKKDTGITLNNTGDSVILKNPNGEVQDQFVYASAATDKSFSRKNNDGVSDWVTNYVPSPGALNIPPVNLLPIANAGSSIINAQIGENINFNGSASSDSDGTIVNYQWNFGDGATGFGAQTVHSYSSAGAYTVTLIVKDDDGAANSASITVSVVENLTPIPYQNQYSNDIKVIEILPNPEIGDNEYIKIKNFGSADIDLKNWSIDDEEGGSKPYLIDYDLIAKPGVVLTFYDADTKISLNNNGDSARVIDPDKKVISNVTYLDNAPKDAPYFFDNGVWKWRTNSSSTKDNALPKTDAAAENKTETKTTETTSPLVATSTPAPDLKDVEVQEPVLSAPSVNLLTDNAANNSNQILKNIFLDSGTLISSLNTKASEAEPVLAQKDFSSNPSPVNPIEPKPYQKPIVIVPVILFSFLLIGKLIFAPQDFKFVLKKLFSSENKGDDLSGLFK